jgi:hypothetical protein
MEDSHKQLTKIINKWIIKDQYEKSMGIDLKTGKFTDENRPKTLEEVKEHYGFYEKVRF